MQGLSPKLTAVALTLLLTVTFLTGFAVVETTPAQAAPSADTPWTKCTITIEGADPYSDASITVNGQTINTMADFGGTITFNLPDGTYSDTLATVKFWVDSVPPMQVSDTYRITTNCGSSGEDPQPDPDPFPNPPDGRLNPNRAALYVYYCTPTGIDIYRYSPDQGTSELMGVIPYFALSTAFLGTSLSGDGVAADILLTEQFQYFKGVVSAVAYASGNIVFSAPGQGVNPDIVELNLSSGICPQFTAYMDELRSSSANPSGTYSVGNGITLTVYQFYTPPMPLYEFQGTGSVRITFPNGTETFLPLSEAQLDALTVALAKAAR